MSTAPELYRYHMIMTEKIRGQYQAIIWRHPHGEGAMPRHITELCGMSCARYGWRRSGSIGSEHKKQQSEWSAEMNVQQKQETITKYVFELSEEERLAAIADPARLVRELKRAPMTVAIFGAARVRAVEQKRVKAAMGRASADVTKKHDKAIRKSPQKKIALRSAA